MQGNPLPMNVTVLLPPSLSLISVKGVSNSSTGSIVARTTVIFWEQRAERRFPLDGNLHSDRAIYIHNYIDNTTLNHITSGESPGEYSRFSN